MLRNYLLVAWRNLFRNKAFSFINLSGLTLGIGCSLLILLWVRDEQAMDRFHANAADLYQVYERAYFDGKTEANYATQGLLALELKKQVPEIKYAAGFERASAPGSSTTFQYGDKVAKMDGFFAGEDFLQMFSFRVIAGDVKNALNDPQSVVISEDMARVFFGSAENAIGKTLEYENKENVAVTAVLENVQRNSSLQFDFLRSWSAFIRDNKWVNNWGNASPATFVQIREGAGLTSVSAKIKDFVHRFQPKMPTYYTELYLQPFTERYLHSTFENGEISGGRIVYVKLFTIVAVFILLIACINFMNLATARAINRAKEIGVRKVMGANRWLLIKQFIGEAIFFCTLAAIGSLLLVYLCLPFFNQLTGKEMSLPFSVPLFWLLLLSIIILTGLVAGSYPALFLSSLRAVNVLKSGLKFGAGAVYFRKSLVVFQFALSVILIVGVIVIYRQVNYIQTRNLGYDRHNLLYLPIEGNLVKNYTVFKNEALKLPGVVSISKMRNSPTVIEHHTNNIEWPGKDSTQVVSFADGVIGYDFIKTMNLQLKEGRDFAPEFRMDSANYIINESAAMKMGFDEPVGKVVRWGNRPGTIIGVLKDFHFTSLHSPIEPLILRLDENWSWGTILVRINNAQTRQGLAALEGLATRLNPEFPFTYQFSDDEFSRLYTSEQIAGTLARYFAILAIIISCLGLFGLASFSAAQRRKEVGVRKVLGASASGIAVLLAGSFVRPVVLAIIIAIPVSMYVMNQWLQNFAYRAEVEWWIFGLAALMALAVALITVCAQAIKAALANPVQSLHAE